MYQNIYIFLLSCFMLMPLGLHASDTDKLSVTPMGRVLMDAGQYIGAPDTLREGVHFWDVRLGFKGKFDNSCFFKVDIGFAGNKVKAKDVFVEYTSGKHTVRVGQFYEPFSMDVLGSTTDMRFPQVAGMALAFANSRKTGVMYTYGKSCYNFSLGLFSEASMAEEQRDLERYSVAGRFVVRPVLTDKEVMAVTVAPSWCKTGRELTISSSGVSSWEEVAITKAEITDARSRFKVGGEFLYLTPKFSFQSEYMFSSVSRYTGAAYSSMGVYGQLSWIVSGAQYTYDSASSCVERPKSRSFELVARYDYLDQNDGKAEIHGGKFHDFSLGVNCYLNKFIAAKLSYSVLKPQGDNPIHCNRAFSMVQLRTQLAF